MVTSGNNPIGQPNYFARDLAKLCVLLFREALRGSNVSSHGIAGSFSRANLCYQSKNSIASWTHAEWLVRIWRPG